MLTPRFIHTTSSVAMIFAGAITLLLLAKPLLTHPGLKAPLNPFGINTSPYGEVLAMAMQGPIDTYWHRGIEDSAHSHTPDPPISNPKSQISNPPSLLSFIGHLTAAVAERTSTRPASPAQKFHARRQIENKLRFAYQLDPAHYANYNAYHFFLTEPQLGTRPEFTPGAAKLAQKTVEYCLSRTDDPRPALTAAAAVENLLELMFNDRLNERPSFTTVRMREYLALLDHCIARHHHISAEWTRTGNWDLLSPQRRQESEERLFFIQRVRDSAEATIKRLENQHIPLRPEFPLTK